MTELELAEINRLSTKLATLERKYKILQTEYFRLKCEIGCIPSTWFDSVDSASGAFRPDEIENANKW